MMLSGLEMKLALILVIGPTYCVFKIPNLYYSYNTKQSTSA